MKIGIIGTGFIGSTLARLWTRAGHEILVSSRHPEQLAPLVKEIGVRSGTPIEAAEFGEVILLSIPLRGIVNLEADVIKAINGKVLIDTSNFYADRDGDIYDGSASRASGSSGWVADQLGHAHVVKAFNTLYYKTLLSESGGQLAIPIAADSEDAIKAGSTLVRDAGYEPFVVGALAEGRYFEPGTPAYGKAVASGDLARLIQEALGSRKGI